MIAAGSTYVVLVALALRFAFAPASPESDFAAGARFFAWLVIGISLFSLACAACLYVRLRRIGLVHTAADNIVAIAMVLALGAVPFAWAVLPAILSPLSMPPSPRADFVWSVGMILGAAVSVACPYVWMAWRGSRRLP
jgi:hypothetical protein